MTTAVRKGVRSRLSTGSVWVVGLFLTVCGCQSPMNGAEDPGRQGGRPPSGAMQDPLLPGIPLPNGLRFVPERSSGRTSGQSRFVTHHYVGGYTVSALVTWFRENMPTAGFTIVTDYFHGRQHTLRFVSREEECNIELVREGDRVGVTVTVAPVPKGSSERDLQAPAPR
ncbi:MAG: hypothetical protein IPM18_10900 [Phycisphaerales bacterium]|nr:hypothetical protein [Phycisphaerales bacterium]